jgi:hypothetical protein
MGADASPHAVSSKPVAAHEERRDAEGLSHRGASVMRLTHCTVSRALTTVRRRSRVATLMLGVVALCSACGATPRAVTTTSSAANLQIVLYSATARVQPGTPISVSTSCRSGEQLLGGGFGTSDLFEYAAYIDASYPSNARTWTVTASAPASYFELEADVYCVRATSAVGLHIALASGVPMATAACPRDMVLLGGGFQSSEPIGVSRPHGNGWLAETWDASIHVYAVCATGHVQRGQLASAAFNAHSSSNGYVPSGGEVACPTGQIAVGGGFAGGDLIIGSQTRGASFAGWSVTAGGDADVTVFADCVVMQA